MALELRRILNNPSAQPFNSLANFVDLASSSINIYVVEPADPNSEIFLFDTRGEEEVNLESDITDNWVENNTSIQDHIGLKPMTITLRGYVGELTNKPNADLLELQAQYRNLSDKTPNLTTAGLNPFLPTLSTQAQYIVNRAEEAYGIYKKANESVKRIDEKMAGIPTSDPTRQQEVFNKIKTLWADRTLSDVYTPYGIFNNMAIVSLNARQDEDSKSISAFSVTFKQIRIADKISTYEDPIREKKAKQAMTMAKQKDKGIKKPYNRSFAQSVRKEGVSGAKKWAKGVLSN